MLNNLAEQVQDILDLSIGAAGIAPQNDLDPAWRFAFGLTLVSNFFLSKNIGIKIQSQGLFPIQWAGGSLYVDPVVQDTV